MNNIFENEIIVDKIISVIFFSVIANLALFLLLFSFADSSFFDVAIVIIPIVGILIFLLFLLLYLRFEKYKNLFMFILFLEIPSYIFFLSLFDYVYFTIFSFFSIIFLLLFYPYPSSDRADSTKIVVDENISVVFYNYVNIFIACFAIIQGILMSVFLLPLRNDFKYIPSTVFFDIGFVTIGSFIFLLVMYKYPFKEKIADKDRKYIRNFLFLFCLVIIGSEIALLLSETSIGDTLIFIVLTTYIAILSLFLYMAKVLNKRYSYNQVLYQASYSILYLSIVGFIWSSYYSGYKIEEQMYYMSIVVYIIYFLLTLEKNINNITIKPTRAAILVFFIGSITFMILLFTYFDSMAEVFFGPSV